MITVGIDPGVKNFAIVALDARGRVFFARMLHSTISSMSMHMAHQRPRFRAVMGRILDHVAPDELMIETFVARGFGTTLTEFVNLMIGGIMVMCDQRNIEEHATMASSWKNDVGRHYAWPDYEPPRTRGRKRASDTSLGKSATGHLYARAAALDVPPHLIDALMLATYLRHRKSMLGVSWNAVHQNIRAIARIMPARDRAGASTSRRRAGKKKSRSTRARPGAAR